MIHPPQPRLTYSEAERVGLALRRMWKGLSGKKKTPRMSEEQWADMVQFVLRHAGDEVAAREGDQ
ncbi:hypothetical protein [Novosphingobium sp.]|uniref:hypothetical protein n=1 Tax=Novosphingobium sp. TaxID=1874826 RepID=UPI00286EA1C6|nr:hypothetical protein [Novosphingobium sp.]